jgi:Flp pilus assembly protein TadD
MPTIHVCSRKRYAAHVLLALMVIGMAGCASPDTADTLSGRVGAPLRLARAAGESGDPQAGVPLYRRLAANPSTDAQTRVAAADGLLSAGLASEAIDIYARVGSGGAKTGALLGLVRAHLALGDAATALQFADQAVALAPGDQRTLVNRGVALDSLQRHGEAQAAYRAALQIAPGSVSARNNLALSLALSDQFDQGIALLEPLARAPSATPRTRQNLALIYGLSGDGPRAAALSRMDLDADRTQANAAFFTRVRGIAR